MDQYLHTDVSVTTIFLARHGQSEWNNQSRITGQLNPGLSPKGRLQSEAIAQCLADEDIAAIYTSTLQRTIDTARPTAVAKQLPIESVTDLNEINLGVLQGRYRDDRDPEARAMWAQWQANMWEYQVPDAERFKDLACRASRALEHILQRHRGRSALIVGHRGTNRVLIGTLLNLPKQRWAELGLRNKFLYRVYKGTTTAISTFTLSGSKTGARHDGFIM